MPAGSDDEARSLLASLQRTHFDATHHCSAWRLRDGVWRANDAGEPAGSAGAPILAAIDAEGLTDAAVVVVRYYGGTKLGVGGLIRAYGEAARGALRQPARRRGVLARRIRLRYAYSHTAAVMRALDSAGAAGIEHGYASEISGAETSAAVPDAELDRLCDRLREQTAGAVQPELLDACILFHAVPAPLPGSA